MAATQAQKLAKEHAFRERKVHSQNTIQISLKDALEQRLRLVPEGGLYTHWHWQQVPVGTGQYKERGLIYEDQV